MRRWALVCCAALVALWAPGRVSALTFDVESSLMAPCFAESLCVDVVARLSGRTAFGTEAFSIPLPKPDPTRWSPSSGQLQMMGSISIQGTYATEEVLARSFGQSLVLGGLFYEDLSFLDRFGAPLGTVSIVQTITCGVPGPNAGPTLSCADGNGGGGTRRFGPDALAWTQADVTVSPAFYGTPPMPVPGTEAIDVRNEVRIEVVYQPIPEPSSLELLLGGSMLLGIGRNRAGRATSPGRRGARAVVIRARNFRRAL